MITVGRIVRPQGNRGQVVVEPETDFAADRFRAGASVWWLRDGTPEPVAVVDSRPADHRWVVGLEGVASITDAEAVRGLELRIPADALRPLGDRSYYVHDLAGCVVETLNGGALGPVVRVELGTGTPTLVVAGSRGEVLVPLAEAICRLVDVEARRIVIDPPEGLIDLNA